MVHERCKSVLKQKAYPLVRIRRSRGMHKTKYEANEYDRQRRTEEGRLTDQLKLLMVAEESYITLVTFMV